MVFLSEKTAADLLADSISVKVATNFGEGYDVDTYYNSPGASSPQYLRAIVPPGDFCFDFHFLLDFAKKNACFLEHDFEVVNSRFKDGRQERIIFPFIENPVGGETILVPES